MENTKWLLGLFLVLLFTAAEAQTIITDRPDQTESSSTIEKMSIQLESGYLRGTTDGQRQILAPTNLFRIGITNGIELRILNQFEQSENLKTGEKTKGLSDLEIGTKIQILRNENVNTEIAFLSHLIIANGTDGLSNEQGGTINKLSIAHELGNVGLGYNLGYNYFGTGKGDLTYSIALGFGLTDKLGAYIEPYGEFTEFNDHLANFDGGFTYLVKDNLQLDLSYGTGLNYDMNYLSIGFSWQVRLSK